MSLKKKSDREWNGKHTDVFVKSWIKDSKRPKSEKISFLWLPDERRKEQPDKKC